MVNSIVYRVKITTHREVVGLYLLHPRDGQCLILSAKVFWAMSLMRREFQPMGLAACNGNHLICQRASSVRDTFMHIALGSASLDTKPTSLIGAIRRGFSL